MLVFIFSFVDVTTSGLQTIDRPPPNNEDASDADFDFPLQP